MAGSRALLLGVVLLALGLARTARADDLPPQLALTVMLKVLTYDAEFGKHGHGDFVVLVPFAPKEETPAAEAIAVASGLEQKAIVGRALRFVAVPLAELDAKVAELSPAALLAVKGTGAAAVKEFARLAASKKLYTLSLDPALVEAGLIFGVAINNGRPQVVINIPGARAAGVDLKPTVLKVARTIQ